MTKATAVSFLKESFLEYLVMILACKDFKSRTTRRQFLQAQLAHLLVCIILDIALAILKMIGTGTVVFIFLNLASALYQILMVLPIVALHLRRLNDTGHKKRLIFVMLVPLFGPIIFWIIQLQKSAPTI